MPRNARTILDQQFLEMRWRALSLAADVDRIARAEGGPSTLAEDERLAKLRAALEIVLDRNPNRAERVQLLFSDTVSVPLK